MPITTTCPNCKARFRLAEETAGKQVRCQKCNDVFVVPAFDGMATSTKAPAEPAATEKAAPTVASLPPLPLPPMPTDSPEAPVAVERDDDRPKDDDDEPRPIAKKRAASRLDRRDKKAGSSMLGLVLVLLGLGAFACLLCGGGGIAWFVAANKPGEVAKKKEAVNVRKEVVANKDDKLKRFQSNKVPAPGPGGAIQITLDPDGRFRHDSQLTQIDLINGRGNRHKLYSIRMEANRTYRIDMMSDQIDSYLILVDDAKIEIAEDDDTGGGLDAQIVFKAPRTGVYQIQATHFPGFNNGLPTTGNFNLLVERLP